MDAVRGADLIQRHKAGLVCPWPFRIAPTAIRQVVRGAPDHSSSHAATT